MRHCRPMSSKAHPSSDYSAIEKRIMAYYAQPNFSITHHKGEAALIGHFLIRDFATLNEFTINLLAMFSEIGDKS